MTAVFERRLALSLALVSNSLSLSPVCPQLLPPEQTDRLPHHQGEHSGGHPQLPGARLRRPVARRRLLRHRPRQGAARRGHPQLRLAAHGRYARDLAVTSHLTGLGTSRILTRAELRAWRTPPEQLSQ